MHSIRRARAFLSCQSLWWTAPLPSQWNAACYQRRHASTSSGVPPSSSPESTAVITSPAAATKEDGRALSGTDQKPSTAPREGSSRTRQTATPGKSKRTVASSSGRGGASSGKDIKVRKRDPWGIQQLRDSWSEDAMTKRETENMSERLHREYRYHPDEQRRYYIKYTALMTIPLIVLSWGLSYYYYTGKPPWHADPQHLLNLIRAADTSPRSKLYLYKLDETEVLPDHVLRYRAAHRGQKEYAERVFKVTHTAFARPSEDDLRRMELEQEEEDVEEEEDGADTKGYVGGGGETSATERSSENRSVGAEVVGGVRADVAAAV